MTTPNAMKLNEHNYCDWNTYFQGRLMAKGILDQFTVRPTNPPDLDDQKAFGILIETIEAGQYRHVEGAANVKTEYEALAIHHRPTTKIHRIQVAMEWARLSWDMRQETLPYFIHRFQTLVKRRHEVGAPLFTPSPPPLQRYHRTKMSSIASNSRSQKNTSTVPGTHRYDPDV
ncbi:hypothetical protein H257_16867 [Aphanomyces astaci]|uniref:DUF4219 domain-containing protein n=1 Tax=Aphanomyces astaci TaxID=112090 RepID=W4FGX5_APHAT|nr:hypothetical protein H257_16867 [Aphanomyces astaci]ETV66782.1 hypothetical protein H257_16867 [Aphanomyces astaci]|eukprot:XP_009843758.1 hypothetical protein H257_16867 [Aphanomyces astaci]